MKKTVTNISERLSDMAKDIRHTPKQSADENEKTIERELHFYFIFPLFLSSLA